MAKDFYTVKEFADRYGYSPDRVYEWLRTGKIRHYDRLTPNAIYRIPKTELVRLKGDERAAPEESVQHPIHKEVDSNTGFQRAKHFADLANIAKSLLVNGLENVSCPGWTTNRSRQVKYLLPSQTEASGYDEISKEQLTSQLNNNMAAILKDRDWFFRYRFMPHLRSELPKELKTELIDKIIEEHLYQLIEILKDPANGKPFKGSCPVCKDW